MRYNFSFGEKIRFRSKNCDSKVKYKMINSWNPFVDLTLFEVLLPINTHADLKVIKRIETKILLFPAA